MQWLNSLPLGDNRPLQIAALLGIAVLAIVVLFVVYRVFFGNRLRFAAGTKARQPRLGLVDAFSLDGQRQLVIVRRDNVEHLLMIGGPNDVVIEAQIVRAQPQATARDKEAGLAPAAAQAAPKPAAPAPEQPKAPPAPAVVPVRPAPQPGSALVTTAVRPPNRIDPVPPPAPKPSQPPAAVTPAPPYAPKTQLSQPPAVEPADSRAPAKPLVLPIRPNAPPPKPAALAAPSPTPTPASPPSPLPPPIVVPPPPTASAAGPAKSLVIPIAPPAPAPKAPNAPPQAAAAGGKGDPFAGLDSLEAEMARLLGRDP
jgi:flagellar protein FliO/FliZ